MYVFTFTSYCSVGGLELDKLLDIYRDKLQVCLLAHELPGVPRLAAEPLQLLQLLLLIIHSAHWGAETGDPGRGNILQIIF